MFVFLYGYGFLSGRQDRGVKLSMRIRLLSGQVFSHFGELWLAASHGGGITSGMSYFYTAHPNNAAAAAI